MDTKKQSFWETFIFVAIVLVVFQTFFDDLSIYQQWDLETRHVLLVTGFMFDVIFTIEFIVRTIVAWKRHDVVGYWLYNRGWIDFLSSVPLLLLYSGPSMFILISSKAGFMTFGIETLNVLKVIKAIRVTRILRLIRVIKILGKIHNTDSEMAQHHVARVTSMGVFSIIMTLMVYSFAIHNPVDNVSHERMLYYQDLSLKLSGLPEVERKSTGEFVLKNDQNILSASYKGSDIVVLNEEDFKNKYNWDDYMTVDSCGYNLKVSILDVHSKIAYYHLEFFFVIIVLVIVYTILYTRHFAQSVSDIIHVLYMGFRKKDYNLQAKMKQRYNHHEIAKLASFYNDHFLPAKQKQLDREAKEGTGGLSIKDFLSFKK